MTPLAPDWRWWRTASGGWLPTRNSAVSSRGVVVVTELKQTAQKFKTAAGVKETLKRADDG